MKLKNQKDQKKILDLYQHIIDKCYRMNLLKESINPEDLCDINEEQNTLISDLDNNLSLALIPQINRILDRSLFDMYQVLYMIDVDEEMIKERIIQVENTTMIPSLIAFAIIDRLKKRYAYYSLLTE